MMKNYDESVEINHNPNWLYIPEYHYGVLIISCSGSGKTYVLLNFNPISFGVGQFSPATRTF